MELERIAKEKFPDDGKQAKDATPTAAFEDVTLSSTPDATPVQPSPRCLSINLTIAIVTANLMWLLAPVILAFATVIRNDIEDECGGLPLR